MRRAKPERRAAGAAGEASPEDAERAARAAAFALLAGRDFSRAELAGRLVKKGHGTAAVTAALGALVAEGVLREERYAGQFVSQHASRGRGPVRIRMALGERGVARETVDSALDEAEADWVKAAREARRRKFGAGLPADRRERARQARFLQYRGFTADQVRAALGPDDDDHEGDEGDRSG